MTGTLGRAIGGGFAVSGWGNTAQFIGRSMAGGAMSHLQGGKFGHGFAAAGAAQLANPAIEEAFQQESSRFIANTIVGGTVSQAAGGKFASGAVTAAMVYALANMGSRGRGFGGQSGGGSGQTDGDHITSGGSVAVVDSSFDYVTHGPAGFAEHVHDLLVDIADTDAGAALLSVISGNGGSVRFNYRAGRPAMARGRWFSRHTDISFDPAHTQRIHTTAGLLPAQTRFLLAHELHHARKNTLSCWFGCDRPLVPPGSVPRGVDPWEVHAVRYTNIIRMQAGAGYQRTHYDGIEIP